MKLKLNENLVWHEHENLFNASIPMTLTMVKDNVIYNCPTEDATHILTVYPTYDSVKEGFIALKIAKRFGLKTIPFKLFKGDGQDTNIYVLLKYDRDIKKVNMVNTRNSTKRQKQIYEQIVDKESFFKQLVFNFFIYNVNFDSDNIHYYKDTKLLGPLLDISIYDRPDKKLGGMFTPLVTSVIKPALNYLDKKYIEETINIYSKRILKMMQNPKMEKFHDKKILDEIITFILAQQKVAKMYFDDKNEKVK